MPTELQLELRKAMIDAAVAVESARGSDPTLPDLHATLDATARAYVAELGGDKSGA